MEDAKTWPQPGDQVHLNPKFTLSEHKRGNALNDLFAWINPGEVVKVYQYGSVALAEVKWSEGRDWVRVSKLFPADAVRITKADQ